MTAEPRRDPSALERALEQAREHADLGLPVGPGTPHSFSKRVVARLSRFLTDRQTAYNHEVLDAIAAAQHAPVEAIVDLRRAIEEVAANYESVRSDQRRELARWRTDHALVERVLRDVRAGTSPTVVLEQIELASAVDDDSYVDFEDQHRGGAELIRERLAAYVADLQPVASLGRVLDVGTGRGEFLEVMRQAGIDAYGVDTNEASVARATERGLEAIHADALVHLAARPEESLAAVTAFQVVEHLTYPQLQELVTQSLRALRPGGLLILETPNPNNLVVGASTFYLDPTHHRPLPPALLHFVLWSHGFDPIEVRYVNPPEERLALPATAGDEVSALQPVIDRLNEMLFAPYDYCVIGHRVGG
jgi:SAM-dependent methyltransferase